MNVVFTRFRLASCLLAELSRCKLKAQLNKTLENLPDTLSEVYDRFISALLPEDFDYADGNLPEDYVYAEAALRWLMFSVRPLSLEELADALAFDFSDPAEYIYDPSRREDIASAIFSWLEGLAIRSTVDGKPAVTLAHASVHEYLISTHFTTKFRRDLGDRLSHTAIARTCISYLLYLADHSVDKTALSDYPLGLYAVTAWCHHLLCCHDRTILFNAAMRLLVDGSSVFSLLEYPRGYLYWSPEGFQTSLFICCAKGYTEGVGALLVNHPNVDQGTDAGRALMIASFEGHTEIVRLLLEYGANVNLTDNIYGSALKVASSYGHIAIVRLLINSGADVTPNYWHGAPLHDASNMGYTDIVRLLLKSGAEVNHCEYECYTALQAASREGHIDIVRLLLESGANVDPQNSQKSPLDLAAGRNHEDIVALLQEWGAMDSGGNEDSGSSADGI
jgi:hypothetical protein